MSLFKSKRQARRQRARDRVNKRTRAPLQITGLKGLLAQLTAVMTPHRRLLVDVLGANVLGANAREREQDRLEAILLVAGLFGLAPAAARVLVESFTAQHNITFRRLYGLVSADEVRLCPPGVLERVSLPERILSPRVIELRTETRRSDGYHSRDTRYRMADGSERIVHEEGFPGELRETLVEERRSEVSAGYEMRMPDFWNRGGVIEFRPQPFTQQTAPCKGCRHYHGQTYGGNLLVCGMHASGWDGETCPDWDGYSNSP